MSKTPAVSRRSRRARFGALAASLLGHLTLLGLLTRIPPSPPAASGERPVVEVVTYLDLPPLAATSSIPPPSASEGGTISAPPPRAADPPPAAQPPHDAPEAAAGERPPTPAAVHPLMRQPLTDPRLLPSFGTDRSEATRAAHPTAPPDIATRAAAAAREEREGRTVSVLGQRILLFGDSSAHHSGLHFNAVGRRATMPEDGRDWQELEMRRQREAFARDSIIRERDRAARVRRPQQRVSPAD